jgi:hypothetical protein
MADPQAESDVQVCAVCELPIVRRDEPGLWPWAHTEPANHMAYPPGGRT